MENAIHAVPPVPNTPFPLPLKQMEKHKELAT